jgi:hypothetical protein
MPFELGLRGLALARFDALASSVNQLVDDSH